MLAGSNTFQVHVGPILGLYQEAVVISISITVEKEDVHVCLYVQNNLEE